MNRSFFLLISGVFLLPPFLHAQEEKKCNCPPVKLYVYDTRLDFNLDHNADASETGKYVEAENSGEWLEGTYNKQQSNEFKAYKGLAPGASQGQTVQYSPADGSGPSGVDFTSSVQVSRSSNNNQTWRPVQPLQPLSFAMSMTSAPYLYAQRFTGKLGYTYTVNIKIMDATTHAVVATLTQNTDDLGKVDDLIDAMIASISPMLTKLRDYQVNVRDKSNNTKWIYLKWKAPEHSYVPVKHSTDVNIQVFDCYDGKPAPAQKVKLVLSDPSKGNLQESTVITDASGIATAHFTAGSEPGDVEIIPEVNFDEVNDKQSVATNCGPLPLITILPGTDKWLVSFSYSSSQSSSETSVNTEGHHTTNITASGSMLVKASSADEDGTIIINTGEGDSISKYSVSANASEKIYSVSRGLDGSIESKEIRNYEGFVPKGTEPGIEFQWGPDGNYGLAGLGFQFTRKGTTEFWKRDDNNHLVKSSFDENDPGSYGILLGHDKDKLKKTKDGFIIDYTESKDTTYTDILGVKHTSHFSETYHVILMRPTAPARGNQSAYNKRNYLNENRKSKNLYSNFRKISQNDIVLNRFVKLKCRLI